ncbi:uncharacterized protein LOC125667163 isoform X2 [Ostrea edulis]|uniref:uncharacterized protein LOC125667163 isoform X2 n=1 Tax=Ostrea edulis TaxID=37623 RepID=UPI0024AEB4D2|nr:uncharacterized protein LOC125667163 isoform X2 [Ostrea edulis]
MENIRRSNSKFKEKEEYFCKPCNFSSHRFGNFRRHNLTRKHQQNEHNPEFDGNIGIHLHENNEINDVCGLEDVAAEQDSVSCNQLHKETFLENTECNEGTEYHHDGSLTEFGNDDTDPIESASHDFASAWFPYESKLHFLLSVLHSSKTHKVSDEVLSFFLYILKDSGLKQVPTLAKIKSFWSEKLKLEDMIQQNEDKNGNLHWMVKPSETLKLIISNPNTAKVIDRHPTTGCTSTQTPQSAGEKWREMKFHWSDGFVLGDIVSCQRNERELLGLIKNFFFNEQEGKVYVELEMLRRGNHSYFDNLFDEDELECLIIMNKKTRVPIKDCKRDALPEQPFNAYIRETGEGMEHFNLLMEGEKSEFFETSPLWKGKPIVKLPLNIFVDDLSANQSRRWAPMHGIQAQASGLPLTEKMRNKNTFFLAASETVSMMDLIKPICEDLRLCKEIGIDAYDALLKREVTLTSEIDAIIADYQMTSLVTNHMGPSALKFCPKCQADKSDPFKMWQLRTATGTKRTLERLKINPSCATQKQSGIKFYQNCLWEHIDPHRDSPIGILHFLYLGLAKHLIQHCVGSLNERQRNLLIIHLKSIDQSDFSYKINPETFFKYLESRQGKDYKHYISKHLYDGRSSLTTIATEFENYLVFVRNHIPVLGNKSKTHFCVHMADDMDRHGHPLHYAEDVFEKNHGAIRRSLQHQNGHAKSRDTVVQFAKSELTKHVITGGFLHLNEEWKQASTSVRSYGEDKKVKSFLGIPDRDEEHESGQLRNFYRTNSRKPMNNPNLLNELEMIMTSVALGCDLTYADVKVFECKEAVTNSGQRAKIGSFVSYDDGNKIQVGIVDRFLLVCTKKHSKMEVAFIKKGEVVDSDLYRNHQLIKIDREIEILRSKRIQNVVHAIHDCKGGQCRIVKGRRKSRTEQQMGVLGDLYLQHSAQNIFIYNKFRLSKLTDKLPV